MFLIFTRMNIYRASFLLPIEYEYLCNNISYLLNHIDVAHPNTSYAYIAQCMLGEGYLKLSNELMYIDIDFDFKNQYRLRAIKRQIIKQNRENKLENLLNHK